MRAALFSRALFVPAILCTSLAGSVAAHAQEPSVDPRAVPPPPPPPPPPATVQPSAPPAPVYSPTPPSAQVDAAAPGAPTPIPVYAQEKAPKEGEPPREARTQVVIPVEKLEWLSKFSVGGFVQPQLIWVWNDENASPNVGSGGQKGLPAGIGPNYVLAKADGTTTNPDFFRIRRARLKTEFTPTSYARFVFEIDPAPTGGPSAGIGTIARNVESVGIARWGDIGVTEFGMGIFKIPFGYEVLQSDADRPFIERSWSEQNLAPGEYDTGIRAYSAFFDKKLAVQLAVVNGAVQGEKTFAVLPDLNKGKDLVGRVNYNFGPFDVGASGMVGQGQIVDVATLRFKQYQRWAWNLEAALHMKLAPIGGTRVFAEVTRAQNYDRGTKYALGLPTFPANLGTDVADLDELGYFVRLEQDITEWATLAGRYDYYSPNSAQGTNGRDTFGVLGAVHFTKGLKLTVEYSHATDNVHKPGDQPASKHIDTVSSVMQVRF